jgi:hypothetical protein
VSNVYDWPLEPWAVVEQQPSSLAVGQELTVAPVGQLVTEPAGYVMHSDISEVWQLMPPPPPPPPLDDELQPTPAVSESPSTPAKPRPIK